MSDSSNAAESKTLSNTVHSRYTDMKQVPLKIHVTHKVHEQAKASCVNLCRQFLGVVENDEGVLDVLIMSNDAHFYFSSYKKNTKSKGKVVPVLNYLRSMP
jgi:hypothetical protein